MTTRLQNLEVQEVSLVDDPAVPKARYLITKRRSDGSTHNTVTDIQNTDDENISVIERIGKSVWDMLGGAPADDVTRARLADGIAKAATDPEDVEKSETVEKKKKCPGCGRFMSAESRHRDSDDKEKSAEAEEPSEEEAEKADPRTERTDSDNPADPNGRLLSADKPEEESEESDEDESAEESEEADEAADDEAEDESEEEAEKSADPNEALLDAFKSMLETELAPLRESIGKSLDATEAVSERVETLEKRKGVSKAAKGSDLEADDADEGDSVFGDVIFSGG